MALATSSPTKYVCGYKIYGYLENPNIKNYILIFIVELTNININNIYWLKPVFFESKY